MKRARKKSPTEYQTIAFAGGVSAPCGMAPLLVLDDNRVKQLGPEGPLRSGVNEADFDETIKQGHATKLKTPVRVAAGASAFYWYFDSKSFFVDQASMGASLYNKLVSIMSEYFSGQSKSQTSSIVGLENSMVVFGDADSINQQRKKAAEALIEYCKQTASSWIRDWMPFEYGSILTEMEISARYGLFLSGPASNPKLYYLFCLYLALSCSWRGDVVMRRRHYDFQITPFFKIRWDDFERDLDILQTDLTRIAAINQNRSNMASMNEWIKDFLKLRMGLQFADSQANMTHDKLMEEINKRKKKNTG